MPPGFTPAQYTILVQRVLNEIGLASPGSFSQGARSRPGGADDLIAHLDVMVEIVRRTTATRIEPYMIQVLEDICDKCPSQFPTDQCDLRQQRRCLLNEHVRVIIEAITSVLIEIQDQPYLQRHFARQDEQAAHPA